MSKPKTTQGATTKPRPIDPATGRQLDEHGLPLNGPARIAALAGKPDPASEPGMSTKPASTGADTTSKPALAGGGA